MARQPVESRSPETEGLPPLSDILEAPKQRPETVANGVHDVPVLPKEDAPEVVDAGEALVPKETKDDEPEKKTDETVPEISEEAEKPRHADDGSMPKTEQIPVSVDDRLTTPAVVENVPLKSTPTDEDLPDVAKPLPIEAEHPDDSDVIESALADMTGVLVEKPKVEAYVEETTDKLGRKVTIRRVFITVVEEIIDEKGAKVIICRVIKKEKRITNQDGDEIVEITDIADCKAEGTEQQPHDQILEHDMEYSMMHDKPHATEDVIPSGEVIEEPLTELDDSKVVAMLQPVSEKRQAAEPTVKREVTETVDQFGRKVTFVRVYVTIFEEVVLESGETGVRKRQISRAQKITNTPKGQVVESIDPPDDSELSEVAPQEASSDTEASSEASPDVRSEVQSLATKTDDELVQSLVPTTLNVVGTPEVERFEKVIVDEHGRRVQSCPRLCHNH